ncbi:MAG: hypothetical protein ACXVB9_06730 [Bdellovibrionota bacterium]
MYLSKSILLLSLLLPIPGHCGGNVSDAEQAARIKTMPIAQCELDLKQLRYIYAHMKGMSDSEKHDFLNQVVQGFRSQGLELPPPPAPCSAPDLALEERCGNLAQAQNQCVSQSVSQ